MPTFNTQEIAEEIGDALTCDDFSLGVVNRKTIKAILDRHLEGMAVVPRRPQIKDGDLFILMETLHKGKTYCIGRYVASHKFSKRPDEFIAMEAREMLFLLDRSLIAEAEKA